MTKIQMVDLYGQYQKIKSQVDDAILKVIESSSFIQGPEVKNFEKNLQEYLGTNHVISCANGTDALQIALMALELKTGDEVIVPAFTYVATAEVIGLLGLVPVMVDVDPDTFNLTAALIEPAITAKTKAIIPVHLFGQCTDMEDILILAQKNNIKIIEDTAQAIGAVYTFRNGDKKFAGTMGDIGCTSFFPSKNLGCFGDGGAIFTSDRELGARIKTISNHGQIKKYYHEVLGVNSRLDTIQAAVLNIKLKHLDSYNAARNFVAACYDKHLNKISEIQTPFRAVNSSHAFHQYTIQVFNGKRDKLQQYLNEHNIPSMIYYPLPLFEQNAFKTIGKYEDNLEVTSRLCKQVLSLPMHTEMTESTLKYIVEIIHSFFYE
jgi:UDP-2-acetamido-2-deoxy-ribo-hexuluronate aminotransferase